jgi:hypothetical protein
MLGCEDDFGDDFGGWNGSRRRETVSSVVDSSRQAGRGL